ncbi:hypothetical protein [Amycolatopsis vancoresmycina]|uniref:DUF1772 domain-containing protein n=1 Tax=Amycolatopsis vancoresmycina DSM 44592 TaxID=1292037 RepID=R1HRW2_9PSEU|nr:hypothetical protein [Amycolatopsis vancoresmycina]EOD66315.1 hypothetical protein H480_22122 [Amycolatopsis vancoresmycina DSM 44592]
MSTASWLLGYGMLSAYCLAGCLMEHFAVFSGWAAVGPGEFRRVQTSQGHGSGIVYVVPKTLLTALVVVMLAAAPEAIPSWPLWAGLAALGASWLSFAVVQLPIQLHIRETADGAAIARLVRTDWFRVGMMAAHFGFAVTAIAAS